MAMAVMGGGREEGDCSERGRVSPELQAHTHSGEALMRPYHTHDKAVGIGGGEERAGADAMARGGRFVSPERNKIFKCMEIASSFVSITNHALILFFTHLISFFKIFLLFFRSWEFSDLFLGWIPFSWHLCSFFLVYLILSTIGGCLLHPLTYKTRYSTP
jgi:hypothetical protein